MVKVKGYVNNCRVNNGTTFFVLSDEAGKKINAVLFKPETKELAARKQLILSAEKTRFPVTVIATVNVYKGKSQLVLDKVYKLCLNILRGGMSVKAKLKRALKAIENAKSNLSRARHVQEAYIDVRRAFNELENAERDIKRAISETDGN
jgi:hypothetical protein